MSILTVQISPDVEERVRRAAAEQNVTVDEFVDSALKKVTHEAKSISPSSTSQSGREILDELREAGALYRTDMTEETVEYAHKLRERSQRRHI
jgi:hypothetical protein